MANKNTLLISLFVVLFACCIIEHVESAQLISIDLGSEYYKVMLRSGRNMDIVLNDQSSRKTESLVGFTTDGERVFGSRAAQLLAKYPERVFSSAHQFLGKNYSNSVIESIKHHFKFQYQDDSSAFGLVLEDEKTFPPEELVGMIFNEAQKTVVASSGSSVKDAILVVPPYLTQHERIAYLNAAKISGLNVLGLVNENLGAAITYARTRLLSAENLNNFTIFYEMGASHTVATLVNYRHSLDKKKNDSILNIQINSTEWDQTLGGRDFDHRLASVLLKRAEEKLKLDLTGNKRVFQRLLKESKKAKEILTANKDITVYIESLAEDRDFSTKITRAEFEELCGDLFERALAPVKRLIENSNIPLNGIDNLELLGGGARILKVIELLGSYLGENKIGRHMNGEEANINGATLYGTTLSISSQSNDKFKIKDVVPYSFAAKFELADVSEEENTKVIFNRGAKYETNKKILIQTKASEFYLNIVYNSNNNNLPEGTDKVLARYKVTNVPRNDSTPEDVPQITLHFRINPSGIVECVKAEAKVNIVTLVPVTEADQPEKEETEGTAEGAPEPAPEAEATPVPEASAEEKVKEEEKPVETEENKGEEKVKEEEEKEVEKVEMKEVKRTKIVTLTVTEISVGIDMDSGDISRSQSRIKKLDREDQERRETEKAKNELESYIYSTNDKLYDDEVRKVIKQEEYETFKEQLSEVGDWLYDAGERTTISVYRAKLDGLKSMGDKLFRRFSEIADRPVAVNAFKEWKESALGALENVTITKNVDESEKESIINRINEIFNWLNEKETEQSSKQLTDDPVWTTDELISKTSALDQEVKKLLKRPRRKPSPTPTPTPTVVAEEEILVEELKDGEGEIPVEIPIETESEEEFKQRVADEKARKEEL